MTRPRRFTQRKTSRLVLPLSIPQMLVPLDGWWVRIWIGAGWEPCGAEECLDQFQNIILLSWEQSLTADSLIL